MSKKFPEKISTYVYYRASQNIIKTKYGLIFLSEEFHIDKRSQINVDFHIHNCIEMTYIIRGSATHIFKTPNEETISKTVGAGDYFFIDYDVNHSFTNVTDDFYLYNFLYMPSFIDKSLFNANSLKKIIRHPLIGFDFNFLDLNPFATFFKDEDESIQSLFEEAYTAYIEKKFGYQSLIRCYLISILVKTFQKHLMNQPVRIHNENIESICKYVENHYVEKITLSEICKQKYFSLPYMSKKFKEVVGISFIEYLKSVRMHNACMLLAETDFSISIIAEMTGYTDMHSFRLAFKDITGLTPLNFRKHNKTTTESNLNH